MVLQFSVNNCCQQDPDKYITISKSTLKPWLFTITESSTAKWNIKETSKPHIIKSIFQLIVRTIVTSRYIWTAKPRLTSDFVCLDNFMVLSVFFYVYIGHLKKLQTSFQFL